MTMVATSTDIQDTDGLFYEFPQIRAALPQWVNEIQTLEYVESDKMTRFVMRNALDDIVMLWSSGEVRSDGTVHIDAGTDILVGNGELGHDSVEDAINTARDVSQTLRTAASLLAADCDDCDGGPTVSECMAFAEALGVSVTDFCAMVFRLIGEARDKAPRELHRKPDVTTELMERDA
ncbi:hypothetical protein ACTU6V_07435 [Microbacterium sp. A204]|uniref:hypothetical protein n=1 Tax=Microbacterium sp. A204 TaxID=3457321 RepID=UPI003FD58D01